MNRVRGEKGFTLIELVLIIVILGILSAVAIVQFGGLSTSARDAAADGAYGSFQSALAIAVGECRSYPTVANATAPEDGNCTVIGTDTVGDFTTMVVGRVSLSGGLSVDYVPGTGVLKICQGALNGGRFATATYTVAAGVGSLSALGAKTDWTAGATCALAA